MQFTEGLYSPKVTEYIVSNRGEARGDLHQQHWRYEHHRALCTPALWKNNFSVSVRLKHACSVTQQVFVTCCDVNQHSHARPVMAPHGDLGNDVPALLLEGGSLEH